MNRGSGIAFAVVSGTLLLVVCFAGLAQQASAATSGYVQFCDVAGVHRTTFYLGETMYYTVVCSGGSYPSFFEYLLKDPKRAVVGGGTFDPPGGYVMEECYLSSSAPTGTWGVTLRYFDDYTLRYKTLSGDSATVSAPIQNNLPTATIDYFVPSSPIQNQPIDFYGTGTDSDGTIASYSWRYSFNGGSDVTLGSGNQNGDLMQTSLQYVGTYMIKFRVTDNLNGWTDASRQLYVGTNSPPTASILSISSNQVYQYQPVTFIGSASDPNGDNTITYREWSSSRDGVFGGNALTVTYADLSAGTHTIRFRVYDGMSWSSYATWPVPLVVNAINYPLITKGQESTFSGSATWGDPASPDNGLVTKEKTVLLDKSAHVYAYASASYPFQDTQTAHAAVWQTVTVVDVGMYLVRVTGHCSGAVTHVNGIASLEFYARIIDADGQIVDNLRVCYLYAPGDNTVAEDDFDVTLRMSVPDTYKTYSIGIVVDAYTKAVPRAPTGRGSGEQPQTYASGWACAHEDVAPGSAGHTTGMRYYTITVRSDPSNLFQDDFSSQTLTGWTLDTRGGSAGVDLDKYCVESPSMKLTKSVFQYDTSASHAFERVTSGNMVVEFNIMETVTSGFAMVYVMDGDTLAGYRVNFAIYGGMFQWYDNVGGWQYTGVDATKNIWYHVVLELNVDTAQFKMMIDGEFAKTGNFYKYYPDQTTHYVDRIYFRSGTEGSTTYKTVYIDNVVVRRGGVIMSDDFKDAASWTITQTGGSVGLDTRTFGSSSPALKIYRNGADSTGVASAYSYFSAAQSQHLFIDALIRIESPEPLGSAVFLMVRATNGAACVYMKWADGELYYYSQYVYKPTGVHFDYGKWYSLGIDVDVVGRSYVVFFDNSVINAQFDDRAPTGSMPSNLYFQAGWPDGLGMVTNYLYVDDVLVTT